MQFFDLAVFMRPTNHQIVKMNLGAVKSTIAFHEDAMLMHKHVDPLVITMIAEPGASVGSLRSIAVALAAILCPLIFTSSGLPAQQ
jgi:hypothetical protein